MMKIYLFCRDKTACVGRYLNTLMCLAACILSVNAAMAQSMVSGTVSDETGQPIAGANVIVKGTNQGTTTNVSGEFSLRANPESVLQISFIGYVTQEIEVGRKVSFKIQMKPDVTSMDEVVVVGYGVVKKRDVTGSVASIDNSLLMRQNTPSMSQALKGQIAGLNIRQTSGKAGGETSVILRGMSAIGKTVQPMVIIDGMPSNWTVLNNMNPSDIERMDVLKDASSTAIYGSRASGGVIIVTTRQGEEGKNRITYSGSVGIRTLAHMPRMMNSEEFMQFVKDANAYRNKSWDTDLGTDDLEYYEAGYDTDWRDMVLRTGYQTSHSISLSGGNKNETHYLSFGYLRENGNQKSDTYERYSLNAKISGKVLEDFTLGGSIYASYATSLGGDGEMLRSAYRLRPWGNPYNEDGSDRFYPTKRQNGISNPIFDLKNSKDEVNRFRAMGSVFLDYKPVEGLVVKTNFMPNFLMDRTGQYRGTWTKNNKGTNPATAKAVNKWGLSYVWENTVSFNRTFGDHSIGATGLFSMETGFDEEYTGAIKGLTYDDEYWYNLGARTDITSLTSSLEKSSMISYMGRINYGYREKYLLTVTGRWDGSSKMAPGHKWGFFPSAAVAWRMSEEPWIKNLNAFSNLKLRLSYGVSGNNSVGNYESWATLGTTVYNWYSENKYVVANGVSAKKPNKGLSWEKSYEYNIGLDMGFFKDRLSVVFDWYNKMTKDLILSRKVPSHQGVTSLKDNVGSVRNKGIELTVNSVNIVAKDFTWTTNLNFSYNKNAIVDLYGDKRDDLGNKWFIGQPVDVNYDYKWIGVWQLGEEEEAAKYGAKPGQSKYLDRDGNGKLDSDDRVILGCRTPKWMGGMTNTFTYKNFDLSVFIYTRQNVQLQSGFHNEYATEWTNLANNAAKMNYWTPENPTNDWFAAGFKDSKKGANYMDTSFWRIGNITLGYELGQKALKATGLSKLRIYFTAVNPVTITDYEGWDPEWADKGATGLPVAGATYMLGVNLTF